MSGSYNRKHLERIAKKVLDGEATEEEKLFLNAYYNAFEKDEDAAVHLTADEIQSLNAEIKIGIDQRVFESKKIRPLYKLQYKIAAAAVVLTILSVALFYINNKQIPLSSSQHLVEHDIAPGGNKATLILADGSVVVLDDAKNGNLASQGGTAVQKLSDGMLTYNASRSVKNQSPKATVYNTIATPRGGQYVVILPDGSKVWLNAASSLKFPTAFSGKVRNVELFGEAYFEVAKNAAMPFRVKSIGQTIEVLGTHFNINAYADEPTVKTTLIEGSVKVIKGSEMALLKPGQQSAILPNSPAPVVISNDIDVEEILSWKNEMFQFNDADIKTVMRQISRWYNVDVEFESKIPADHYRGKVSRNVNVSQVLKILELSGVNFKIEGKKIIVK